MTLEPKFAVMGYIFIEVGLCLTMSLSARFGPPINSPRPEDCHDFSAWLGDMSCPRHWFMK